MKTSTTMKNEAVDLGDLIAGCRNKDRKYQKLLYKSHYGFVMGICLRYAHNRYVATEIMNSGFLKVFSDLQKYDFKGPFKAWLGRIMIHAAIDYYHSNLNESYTNDIENVNISHDRPLAKSNFEYQELLTAVQQLPHLPRLVFNLCAIDGYTHKEIDKILGKSEGTYQSHLFKARKILRKMIEDANGDQLDLYG
jgi:RNA polymerase sigma factor (sigma-70 family)